MAGTNPNPNPNPKQKQQSKVEKVVDSIGSKVVDRLLKGMDEEIDETARRKKTDAADLERRRVQEDAENARLRQEAEARRQADAAAERARIAAIELERNALRAEAEQSRRNRRNFWLILLGIVAIALITSLITFLVMRDPTPSTLPTNPSDPLVLIDSCCPPGIICDTPCPPAPSGGGSSRVNVKVIPEKDFTKTQEEAMAGGLDYCDSQTDLSVEERRACMERALSL